jgi:hypothetical protein
VSEFTEPISRETMLESIASSEGQLSMKDTTTLEQKVELVEIFFAAVSGWAPVDGNSPDMKQTSGILDIVSKPDVLETLDVDDPRRSPSRQQATINNLVIAIGARCHTDAMAYRLCEKLHFDRCRPYLNLDNLADLNTNTIRIFVLAAFYMLCACNRNMGYMYLGLAARAAQTLGLHHIGLEGTLHEAEKASR